MNVRLVALACALAFTVAAPRASGEAAASYAESVAVMGVSADGKSQVNLRLARFPGKGTGELWVQVMHRGRVYTLIDESLPLVDAVATPVAEARATFAAGGVQFVTRDRHAARLRGNVAMCVDAARTAHFLADAKRVSICIEVAFVAHDAGVRVKRRGERLEVFGVETVKLTAPDGTFAFELPGKWHEQVGERPAFSATPFTYFAVQGPSLRMLAVRREGIAGYGYLMRNGNVAMLDHFTIEPHGPPTRRFLATFDDGTTVEGVATVVQDWSHPLEGKTWRGATVTVATDLGPLAGNLNDWMP